MGGATDCTLGFTLEECLNNLAIKDENANRNGLWMDTEWVHITIEDGAIWAWAHWHS